MHKVPDSGAVYHKTQEEKMVISITDVSAITDVSVAHTQHYTSARASNKNIFSSQFASS